MPTSSIGIVHAGDYADTPGQHLGKENEEKARIYLCLDVGCSFTTGRSQLARLSTTQLVKPAIPTELPSSSAMLVIRFFGAPNVSHAGRQVGSAASRKGLWLLALLALHAVDKPIERGWLAGVLWPETSDAAAQFYLRRTLVTLRQALGMASACIFRPTPRTLCLDLAQIDCDLITFHAAIRRGDDASLRFAVDGYREPFLLGCTEEWAFSPREACKGAALLALETLADRSAIAGDVPASIHYLRRALEIDPLRETAVRSLMEALSIQNDPAGVAETFRAFRERLYQELRVNPDPRTVMIYQGIVAGLGGAPPNLEKRTRPSAARPESTPDQTANQRTQTALPSPTTPLIGRERECRDVLQHLTTTRLVTLTGTGGVGKTRLAVAVAHAAVSKFTDGAYFVDAAPIDEPILLPAAILTALGRRQSSDSAPPIQSLLDHLRDQHVLLVLDNCEHLVAACAQLVGDLLDACPHLSILATSREPIRTQSEMVWRVPNLTPANAAALFVERAKRAGSVIPATSTAEETIAGICRRLDGIPLAIEMAAAWMRAMTAPQIAARLADTFRLLTRPEGGQAMPRHQTLRAALDWSFDLLTPAERTLFGQLSVFVGGWTLEAAEAVCIDIDSDDGLGVLERLVTLVDKSLVVYAQDEYGNDEGRYRFLETTRSYAASSLLPGARDPVAYRHAAHFLAVAETAKRSWDGPEETTQLSVVDAELPNVRAALGWCLITTYLGRSEQGPSSAAGPDTPVKLALRLSATLMRYWKVRGLLVEGRQFIQRALAAARDDGEGAIRALALNACGGLSSLLRDMDYALLCHHEALRIRTAISDKRGMAVSLANICQVEQARGNVSEARAALLRAFEIYSELGDTGQAANIQQRLAGVDPNGSQEQEHALLQRLARAEQAGDQRTISEVSADIGLVYLRRDDTVWACRHLRRGLSIVIARGDRIAIAQAFEALAPAMSMTDGDRAVPRLFGAASTLRLQTQSPISPTNRLAYDSNSAAAKELLGNAAYEAAFAEGQSWSLPQSTAYALTGTFDIVGESVEFVAAAVDVRSV